MKKLTSALVASSLVLGLVSTAFAAPSADEVTEAYGRLSHYGIVQGKADPATGTVSPALEADITRAELLTILVRAWGQEDNAKLLKGATTGFADVDGVAGVEWTTGYVFIGSRIAAMNGGQKLGVNAEGTQFNPSGNLTAVQTLAFTMKFLGLTVPGGDNWVADTIKAAKDAGLITDADEAKFLANPGADVNRGEAFAMLDNLFASYNKLEGGKTIYTTYIDEKAPMLTVNKPELTTDKAALTVTGSVSGDFTGVYLGSEKITVNEDGTFSVEVALTIGANDITFTAMDMVGNSAEESFSVTRNPGVAAKITASMASTVVAGEAVDLAIEVTDANGVVLEVAAADITVTVGGSVGTYADGKFTAAEKVSTGTVTVSYGELTPATVDVSVVAGALAQLKADNASVAKGDTIKLTPTDKYGNAIASGVSYTWDGTGIAVTNAGLVFTAEAGKYEITATADSGSAKTTVGVYGAAVALQVSAPESVTANGKTVQKITVVAVDEFGNAVGAYEDGVKIEAAGLSFFDDEAAEVADAITPTAVTPDKNGVVTVYVTVPTALGGEEVAVKASQADDSTIKGSTTFNAVIPVASGLKVAKGAPVFMAANESTFETVKVNVVDQDGETVDELFEVAATVTGPAVLDDESAIYTGSAPAEFVIRNAETIGTEGTITLTFTVDGVGSVTHTVKHVIAGNPAKLALTADKDSKSADLADPFVFTLEVQDRNGVPVKVYEEETVVISLPSAYRSLVSVFDANDVELTLQADNTYVTTIAEGAKTAKFKIGPKSDLSKAYVGDITPSVTVKVTDMLGSTHTKLTASKTVALSAGEIDHIALDREDSEVYASVADPKFTFGANLADAWGNTVAKADVEIAIYADSVAPASNSNLTLNGKAAQGAAASTLKLKTDAEGKVSFEAVARPYADTTYQIWASYDGTNTVAADFNITNTVIASMETKLYKQVTTDVNGVPTTSTVQATQVNAGETFWLVVTLKDNYGGPKVLGDVTELKVVAPKDTIGQDVLGDTYTATELTALSFVDTVPGVTLTDGQYAIELIGGKAGVVAVGAKYKNQQTELSKTSNISVRAGTLDRVVVNDDEDIEVTGAGKVHGAYTVSLSDVFGNTVPLTVNAKITLDAGVGSTLTFRKDAAGATVTSLTTKSSTSFYFVATATGTYTVTYTVTVDKNNNGTVDLGEDYTPAGNTFTIVVNP